MDTDLKQSVDSANIISSNDERCNSGLREGNIVHAEVNAALRTYEKTIIFGQQNRLRGGLLMEDEKLERYHSGHELVKFFYSGVRQLPEYLVDALLQHGVSVTLVKSPDLLVFRYVRAHQSFHTGRARKTIYMPEAAVAQAFDRGYDYWAIGEVIIQESWPLLDFLLILELVRHAQVRLRKQYILGREFVLKTLRVLNKHRKERVEDGADGDREFDQFLARYDDDLYRLNREIPGRDAYVLADEIFDEELERKWAHK
jgi:hypothetical protein